MHILFDARMINNSGIGRIIQNTLRVFEQSKIRHTISVIVNANTNYCLKGEKIKILKLSPAVPIYSLQEQVLLPIKFKSINPDLIHFPNFNVPLFLRRPFVTTINDLIYYLSVQACPSRIGHKYIKYIIPYAAKKSKMIITISEYSKADIVRHFGVPEKKIRVIYPAVDLQKYKLIDQVEEKVRIRQRFGIKRKFIFYTGNHQPRKNLELLIRAFQRLRQRKDFQLVIGGYFDKRYAKLYYLPAELGLGSDEVLFPGYATEDDLVLLYNAAELFVFPSKYEGFGLPPLEAMACGVPVVSSSATSLPEVVADAALLFDPDSLEELTQKMEKLLSDYALRARLRSAGFERIRKFSWDNFAEQTLSVYESLMA